MMLIVTFVICALDVTGPWSAFKKWSGHVVQNGSRKGMFGYRPREKFGFTKFLDPMLLHLERVLGLRKM